MRLIPTTLLFMLQACIFFSGKPLAAQMDSLSVASCGITFYTVTLKEHGSFVAIWRVWEDGPSAKMTYHESLVHSINGVKIKSLEQLKKYLENHPYSTVNMRMYYLDTYKTNKYQVNEYPYQIVFTNNPNDAGSVTSQGLCVFGNCVNTWSQLHNKEGYCLTANFEFGQPSGQGYFSYLPKSINGFAYFDQTGNFSSIQYVKENTRIIAVLSNGKIIQVIYDYRNYYVANDTIPFQQLFNTDESVFAQLYYNQEQYESRFNGFKYFYDTLNIPIWDIPSAATYKGHFENGKLIRIDSITYVGSGYQLIGNFTITNKKISGTGDLHYRLRDYDKFETRFSGDLIDDKPDGVFMYEHVLPFFNKGYDAQITAIAAIGKIERDYRIYIRNKVPSVTLQGKLSNPIELMEFKNLVSYCIDTVGRKETPLVVDNNKNPDQLTPTELYYFAKQGYDEVIRQLRLENKLTTLTEGLLDPVNSGNDLKYHSFYMKPNKPLIIIGVSIYKNGIYIKVNDSGYDQACNNKSAAGIIHTNYCTLYNYETYEKFVKIAIGVDGQREPVYYFIGQVDQ